MLSSTEYRYRTRRSYNEDRVLTNIYVVSSYGKGDLCEINERHVRETRGHAALISRGGHVLDMR